MIRSSILRRLLAVPVAVGLAAGVMVATSTGTASAAPIGTLSFYSGVNDLTFNNQDDTFAFQTDGACPTSPTLATNFLIRVSGPGLPAAPNLVNIQGNTAGSTVGSITAGPFDGPVQFTLAGFAVNQAQPGGYLGAGTYTLELVCRQSLQAASLGEFVGQITITGSGASSVVSTSTPVTDADTTTALAVSPTGTAGWGAPVTLTATVTNDDPTGDVPAGTVLFKDDGVAIGSAIAVNGSGVATTTVSDLDLGDNEITAEFTGDAGFNDSVTAAATTVPVALAGPTVVRAATLSGTVKVGGTVVCNAGTWSGATSYQYEFLKNGVVAQGPGSDFDIALTAADYNKTLSCRVTGINPEGSATSTTAAPKVALGSAAVATKAPRILYSGTAANVGETLKAFKGTWSPTATYTYNYIWKRGTTTVKQGSTATSYKATAADKGKKLTLIVQVKRTGYATATKTSAAVVVK